MITSVYVHYGQVYVESCGPEPDADMAANFRGQEQGLCGAMLGGTLFLITGLHTGRVGFEVRVHDAEPPIDDGFEDIVEVSFRPVSDDVRLVEWSAQRSYRLPLQATDYRVRYSARGMDAAHDGTVLDGDPIIDSYMLEFWPAVPTAQCIVKQTAGEAAYWHEYARGLSSKDE